jgi:hypothetical protein
MYKNKIITLEEYNINKNKKKFYYLADIKNTLKINKLDHYLKEKKKKKEYETLLFDYFEKLNEYTKNLDKIILIQKTFRKYLNSKKLKTLGIGFLNKSKCSNQEDFYTLDNINEIEDKYFFSYEQDGHIYFFDIRSFNKLLNNDSKNPYTREDIPPYAIEAFNNRQKELKDNNIVIEDFIPPTLSKEQTFNSIIINLFQKIDVLNVTAGGTNIAWFTELNITQLKMLYKILEDIWNYRSELSLNKKKEIVPSNDMFKISIFTINKLTQKRKLQYCLLYEMDKLVSSAVNIDDRITGAYFVLTALVEVSPQCMEALPWLIQHN